MKSIKSTNQNSSTGNHQKGVQRMRWHWALVILLLSGCGSGAVFAENCHFKSYTGTTWTLPRASSSWSCVADCQNFANQYPDQRPALCYQQLPDTGGAYSMVGVLTNSDLCTTGITVQAQLETRSDIRAYLNDRLTTPNSLASWLHLNGCHATNEDTVEEKVLSIAMTLSPLTRSDSSILTLTAKFGTVIPQATSRVERARAVLEVLDPDAQESCRNDFSACPSDISHLYGYLPSASNYIETFPLWAAISLFERDLFSERIIESFISQAASTGGPIHLSASFSPMTKLGAGWSTSGSYFSVGPTQ